MTTIPDAISLCRRNGLSIFITAGVLTARLPAISITAEANLCLFSIGYELRRNNNDIPVREPGISLQSEFRSSSSVRLWSYVTTSPSPFHGSSIRCPRRPRLVQRFAGYFVRVLVSL